MKLVWEAFGKTEKPYTVKELHDVLTKYTGMAFANNFFNNYIYDSKMPEMTAAFENVGVLLNRNNNKLWFGGVVIEGEIMRNTTMHSPAYNAGLEQGDILISVGDFKLSETLKFNEILSGFRPDDKVKIIFKDFPLNGFESKLAAEASYCAQDQQKYWEYHNELYKNWGGERTGWITRESLTKFAEIIELNTDDFNQCLDENKYQNKVNSMHEFGKEIGIDATPSFLVFNDQKIIKIRGNQPLEVFLKTFDELEFRD